MRQSSTAYTAPASETSRENRRLTTSLFTFSVFLYWMALYLYAPTLPVYVESKSDNLALVGTILSMYGLWQLIIRLPVGIASDALGRRKPFIVIGFALAGLGAWMMGSADNASGLLVGRSVTGLAAATWVPLTVVFSSLFPPKDAVKATALLTFVGSAGRVLATGVTGTLNELGGYSLAFNLAAGAAGLAILVVLLVPEKRRPSRRMTLQSVAQVVRRQDVLLPSLLSALGQFANWATSFSFIPILARQLGATDVTQSLLLSTHVVVVTLGNLATTTITSRFSAQRLVFASFVLLFIGTATAVWAHTLPWLFVAQIVIGMSMGIGYPTLMGMSIEKVDEGERTTAMGLHQAVYALGMFGGPWLGGILADLIGIRPMFGVTAVFCLLLGILGTRRLKREA